MTCLLKPGIQPRHSRIWLLKPRCSRIHFTGSCTADMDNLFHLSSRTVTKTGMRPIRVSIEGNIGSGKSTCMKYFSGMDHVETHPEPIEEWRNMGGHNLLSFLYSDLDKWNFPFQNYVYLSRLRLQTSPPSSDKVKVKMFERSLQNSHYCFTETAFRNGNLLEAEYKILTRWYDWVAKNVDIHIDLIVYLKSSPERCLERIMQRNRTEESEIPLKYLKQVHDSYERWLSTPDHVPCEVITIDANQDLKTVLQELERHSYKILNS